MEVVFNNDNGYIILLAVATKWILGLIEIFLELLDIDTTTAFSITNNHYHHDDDDDPFLQETESIGMLSSWRVLSDQTNNNNQTQPTSFIDFAKNLTIQAAREDNNNNNEESMTDGQIISSTLTIYGSLFGVCVLAFCVLRQRFPRVYNIRSGWTSKVATNPLAAKSHNTYNHCSGFFSWPYKVWLVSDIELSDDCGMDALCLIRVLEWGARLSFGGSLIGCCLLMPIYATAGGIHTGTGGVEQLNTSNVPEGSDSGGRFVATVCGAYLIFGYAMYSMLQEFEWFYNYRYQFLKKALPRNYTVYVRNLSEEHLSKESLAEYFSNFEDHRYSSLLATPTEQNAVAVANETKAWVALKIPKLKQMVSKRTSVLTQLEHAINIETHLGRINMTKDENGAPITVVDALFGELREWNQKISVAIQQIESRAALRDPNDYRADDYKNILLVQSSQRMLETENEGIPKEAFYDTVSPDRTFLKDPDEETPLEDGPTPQDEEVSMMTTDSSSKDKNSHRSKALYQRASSIVDHVGKVAISSASHVGEATKVAAKTGVEVLGTQVGKVASLLLNKNDDGAPMKAGFVSFSTLRACQAAKQMIHSKDVFGMEVLEAPGADDINWANVGKTHTELQLGALLSISLTTILCFFWTIVITFIAALSSVQGLTGLIPGLAQALEEYPWLNPLLDQISPLMLVVANSLLKILLEILSKFEGHVSSALVEASLFSKLSAFAIIQTFFVSALSGSIISELSAIFENPSSIVSLLANSLPNRSSFFIQLILVQTSVILSMELLRISPIGIAIARSILGPKLTEDERQTTWMGLRPLADPMPFMYAEHFSSVVLLFVVYFVYATLAPITSIFAFLCFCFGGIAFRHQFIYIYPTLPDGGGKLWIQFMQIIPFSLLIAEFTIVGLLALKVAPVASALMIPLVIVTVLFNIYIRQKHFEATDFLPGIDCVEADQENNANGPMDMRFLANRYKHPELLQPEVFPSNATLEQKLKHGMIANPEEEENKIH